MVRQRHISLVFPFLLVFYEISTYLSNDMYLPAIPEMMHDLHFSTQQAQLTLTTWFLGSASLPLFVGAISDRFGRRRVLLLGGIIYILSSVICAITSNIHILLFARFVEGAMIPSMMVAGYACIHESYETKEAVRILALMASITVLAPALGPLTGSIILYFSSWRTIFWVIVGWATFAILLLSIWMPETLTIEKRQSLHVKLLFENYWAILTNKQFMLLMLVLGFIFSGFIAWITAGPLLVITYFHYSAIAFGLIQGLIFAVYIFANRLVRYLLDKIGIHSLIRFGLIIALSGGLAMFIFSICFPNALYAFIGSMTIYSFGAGLCFSPLNRSIIEASDAPMGMRVALFTVFFTGFGAWGSAMTSYFFNGTIASLAYLISTASIAACFLKYLKKPDFL